MPQDRHVNILTGIYKDIGFLAGLAYFFGGCIFFYLATKRVAKKSEPTAEDILGYFANALLFLGGRFGSEVGIEEYTKNLMRISLEFHTKCMYF
jgi:hypothetical protein